MALRAERLPAACRHYVALVSVAGLAVAAQSLYVLVAEPVSYEWFALAALTLLTGSFTVRIPGIEARLSVSETFVFASVLLFGPAAGLITALLDALIISLRLGHHAREPFRVVFNASVAALSTWLASHAFYQLAGIPPYSEGFTPLKEILLPLAAFTAIYFLANSWLVTVALALERGSAALPIWRHNFLWLSVNYFGSASVAGLLVTYTTVIDLTVLGIIVPLLLISYLTFKTSLGRIEDANIHLKEVNQLYLSTIETLAMAIDAKDQITHGHIRRVQRYAVGLARAVGVNDEAQIKAIEAAALLHDMGKLAIPEFILNKPGKLSRSEFEIMKTHAKIGADILSAIAFPYPVVPIVRHHHENWDGSGYPDGKTGTAIPVGARILAVVDCFDALTSDRPYRPRLSDEAAIAILMERRGSMYDPLVVDTFIRVHTVLAEMINSEPAPTDVIGTLAIRVGLPSADSSPTPAPIDLNSLALLEALTCRRAFLDQRGIVQLLAKYLFAGSAQGAVVLWIVDQAGTSISPAETAGSATTIDLPISLGLGDRLTGWVAAHRAAVWNTDASLDLGVSVVSATRLEVASAVPLVQRDELIGCVSIYGATGTEMTVSTRVQLEAIGPVLAEALASVVRRDSRSAIDLRDPLTRNAALALLDATLSHPSAERGHAAIRSHVFSVSVDIAHGRDAVDREVERGDVLAYGLSQLTSEGCSLFRLSDTDLLVHLLPNSLYYESPERLREALTRMLSVTPETDSIRVRVNWVRSSIELRELFGDTGAPAPHEGTPATAKRVH